MSLSVDAEARIVDTMSETEGMQSRDSACVLERGTAGSGGSGAERKGIKRDDRKARYDLIPVLAEEQIAAVLTFGAATHDERIGDEPNYKRVGNPRERYYSAARRHLQEWRKGNLTDDESGLPHLAHAASNILFLLEIELEAKAKAAKKAARDAGGEVSQ